MLTIGNLKFLYESPSEDFDYPEYSNLDDAVVKTLSPEAVDAIQFHWGDRQKYDLGMWMTMVLLKMTELGAEEVK